ncbi:MAG: SPOR domain-containing protein [Psychrobium sp.]|nr:SPOR domain-containing protein [Psychrobium sp.]
MMNSASKDNVSAMDVKIEPQTQLISRIQLATDSYSRLNFLHGPTGVGKSYVAGLLQEKLSNTQIVKLIYKSNIDEEQFKHQLICELATDDFSDLNQPLSEAVVSCISFKRRSLLIIVDNARQLPQTIMGMLWQAVTEFNRKHKSSLQFNVLLIGETPWAMALYKALDKKVDSQVAEFSLSALSKEQATDFMMMIHANWSDQKIKQFIAKVSPQYLLPNQLIYAQVKPLGAKNRQWLLLGLSASFVFIISVVVVGYLYLKVDDEPVLVSTADKLVTTTLPDVKTTLLFDQSSTIGEQKPNTVVDEIFEQPAAEMPPLGDTELATSTEKVGENSLPIEDIVTSSSDVITPDEKVTSQHIDKSVHEQDLSIKNKAIKDKVEQEAEQIAVVENVTSVKVVNQYVFDEVQLLDIADSEYALMLGGYSTKAVLQRVFSTIDSDIKLYQYQTTRNGKDWFVLLHGQFSSLDAANKRAANLPQSMGKFEPWAKSLIVIHQEITAVAPTNTDSSLN